MPKKSARHSTAPDAYWFTVQSDAEPTVLEVLWLRVIEQAWRDCHDIDNNDVYKARDAQEALWWVIENDNDFDAVCNLAGVNPDQFREVTLKSVTERYDRAFLAQVFAQHFNFGR